MSIASVHDLGTDAQRQFERRVDVSEVLKVCRLGTVDSNSDGHRKRDGIFAQSVDHPSRSEELQHLIRLELDC